LQVSRFLLVTLVACGPARPVEQPAPIAATPDAAPAVPDDELPVAPPDPVAAKLAIDWATTPLATDADAIAVWRAILPHARDVELRFAQIPDEAVAPLGKAALRAGPFACPALVGGGCEPGFLGYADPVPDATFADPCLRRTVAFWALAHLDNADVAAMEPELDGLLADPAIDVELVEAILSAAGDQPEATRMTLIAATMRGGHGAAVDDELFGLSEPALVRAATDLHVDAAVDALDVALARPVYLAAARDLRLRPATRATALRELALETSTAPPRDLEQVLVAALADPDCGVAGTAANLLAGLGRKRGLPARPRSRKAADAMRALCVLAAADHVEAARAFVGPAGLKQIERSYDPDLEFVDDENRDGDGDPRTERTVDTIVRADLTDIPYADHLAGGGATCRENTCTIRAGAGVTLTLGFVPARDGGLWLDAIERHDRGGCD
jgi:hypothetical protein